MTRLEPDGRLPLGAECVLSDGREAKVIRRSPIRDAMTLVEKDGRNSFRSIRIYDALLKTADGQKVRQERIRIEEPDKPIPPHGSRPADTPRNIKEAGK